MSLKNTLLLSLLAVGLVPALILSGISVYTASTALEQQSFQQLISLRDVKKSAVERYFNTAENQIASLAQSPVIRDMMSQLTDAYDQYQSRDSYNPQRQTVREYYRSQFLPQLTAKSPGHNVSVASLVDSLSDTSIQLQHDFIAANPHPLGQKHLYNGEVARGSYHQLHSQIHPYLEDFLARFGYYDIFLVSSENHQVVYSVFKELDFATSLQSGPYRHSGLADAYRAASGLAPGQVAFVDFAQYLPSYNAPAGFIGTPIVNNGRTTGVLIFQFPIDSLNQIMAERSGLGESGETYLVGNDNLMRSDSYLDPQHHSVEASFREPAKGQVNTDATAQAKAGETGAAIVIDYNNNPVLSAFGPLQLNGLSWNILAEIDQQEAFAAIDKLFYSIVVLVLLAVGIILWVAWVLTRKITAPLGGEPLIMQKVAEEIAQGDLTRRFENSHRATGVYASMQQMVDKLKSITSDITMAAGTQTDSAERLSVITTQTSRTVDQQTDQVHQIATAIQQMSATVNEVSESTHRTADASKQAHTKVRQSASQVVERAQHISDMAASISETREQLFVLKDYSDSIAGTLEQIQGIADQTNLLALNAAIEAARAGEMGRGFAVVADEVRTLAKNTQDATQTITPQIEMLVTELLAACEKMDANQSRAMSLSKASDETAQELSQATQAVDEITEFADQIAAAVEEQSTVADQISQSITEISEQAQQTRHSVSEISSAGDELAQMSLVLQKNVEQFKL